MNLDLGKYVDIKTNFGMKHYFGQEQYKHILIHFLNSLFLGERTIPNLQYRPTEQDADYSKERGVLYEKLNYKLIILPKFLKKETELETDLDYWLFLFQNLGKLTYAPDFLDKHIFQLIFEIGEIAKLNKEDRMAYEILFKNKRDERSILATAKRIAREEGEQKGLEKAEQLINTEKKSVIQNLINQLNLSNKEIANLTNTDIRFVQHIRLAMKK